MSKGCFFDLNGVLVSFRINSATSPLTRSEAYRPRLARHSTAIACAARARNIDDGARYICTWRERAKSRGRTTHLGQQQMASHEDVGRCDRRRRGPIENPSGESPEAEREQNEGEVQAMQVVQVVLVLTLPFEHRHPQPRELLQLRSAFPDSETSA